MRNLGLMLAGVLLLAACRDSVPPVQRVPVPEPGRDTYREEYDQPKPLPAQPQEPPRGNL